MLCYNDSAFIRDLVFKQVRCNNRPSVLTLNYQENESNETRNIKHIYFVNKNVQRGVP